jgi:hypothetical protein
MKCKNFNLSIFIILFICFNKINNSFPKNELTRNKNQNKKLVKKIRKSSAFIQKEMETLLKIEKNIEKEFFEFKYKNSLNKNTNRDNIGDEVEVEEKKLKKIKLDLKKENKINKEDKNIEKTLNNNDKKKEDKKISKHEKKLKKIKRKSNKEKEKENPLLNNNNHHNHNNNHNNNYNFNNRNNISNDNGPIRNHSSFFPKKELEKINKNEKEKRKLKEKQFDPIPIQIKLQSHNNNHIHDHNQIPIKKLKVNNPTDNNQKSNIISNVNVIQIKAPSKNNNIHNPKPNLNHNHNHNHKKRDIITQIPIPVTQKITTINKINPITKINKVKAKEKLDFTLPSIEIDKRHKIDYYYPFFYRTNILQYKESIDYKELSNMCIDLGCSWCDKNAKNSCFECRQGFFLHQNSCYTSCPLNHYADIFKKKCHPLNNESK